MPIPEFPLHVPNHANQPNDSEDLFFGEIEALGPVLSAQTNVNRLSGRRNWPASRITAVIVGAALGLLVGAIVSDMLSASGPEIAGAVLGGCLVGILFFSWLCRPWDVCSIVAKRGCGRIRRRGEKVRQEILPFERCAELRSSQVRMYYNGVYLATQYQYHWLDSGDRALFRIRGAYREKKRKPVAVTDPYRFALAAEAAWVQFRSPALLAQFERGEAVRFRVGKKHWIEVGRGFVTFGLKREPRRLTPNDVKEISLTNGVLVVKPQQGGWHGTIRVNAAKVSDLRIFIGLMEKALGIRFP